MRRHDADKNKGGVMNTNKIIEELREERDRAENAMIRYRRTILEILELLNSRVLSLTDDKECQETLNEVMKKTPQTK